MRAVQIASFGGPEVLEPAELPVPAPRDGEVLVKVALAGLNFADVHQREDAYLAKFDLPLVLGGEVVGTVERAAGELEEGRRVVALLSSGGYAEYAVAPLATTFALPDGLDDGAALALLVQGLTAWHLYRTAARLRAGESVVVVSAAGGVGSLAVQLAKPFGADRVIALASSTEKRRTALALGADEAVDPGLQDLSSALQGVNGGEPVDVVLEMAGGRVFDQCLAALAPFGRLVVYGIAGREQNDVATGKLMRGGKSVVGFWLRHCLGRREMMEGPLNDLFERAAREDLKPLMGGTYPLEQARRAHEDLQARRTSGKLLLDPGA